MTSELSPARQRLAELQKTKGAAVAKMTALQSQIGKLDEIIAAISPARAALDAADHEHKAALSRWAKGEDAAQPRTSRRRRASLVDALAQAELDASAAVAARVIRSRVSAQNTLMVLSSGWSCLSRGENY